MTTCSWAAMDMTWAWPSGVPPMRMLRVRLSTSGLKAPPTVGCSCSSWPSRTTLAPDTDRTLASSNASAKPSLVGGVDGTTTSSSPARQPTGGDSRVSSRTPALTPGAGPAGLGRALDVEPAVVVRPEADVGLQHLVAAAPEGALVDADEADRLLDAGVRRHHLEGALDHQVAPQLEAGRLVLGEGQRAALGHLHPPGAGGRVHGDGPLAGDGDGVVGPGDATPGGGVGPGAGGGRLDVGLRRRREGEQQGERYRRSKP